MSFKIHVKVTHTHRHSHHPRTLTQLSQSSRRILDTITLRCARLSVDTVDFRMIHGPRQYTTPVFLLFLLGREFIVSRSSLLSVFWSLEKVRYTTCGAVSVRRYSCRYRLSGRLYGRPYVLFSRCRVLRSLYVQWRFLLYDSTCTLTSKGLYELQVSSSLDLSILLILVGPILILLLFS